MEGGRNGDGLKYISACDDREFYRQYGDNLELQGSLVLVQTADFEQEWSM
jgi:hypothetical protein